MRVPNRHEQCIGYRLNILGIRVYRTYCQLVAKIGKEWVTVGPRRDLPVVVPADPHQIAGDPLLLTAYQYEQEHPGSDFYDVLAQCKDFETALNQNHHDLHLHR